MIPLAAAYLLPTIIAFKFRFRHHYAWALAILNVVFGSAALGWFGFFVWALICLWNPYWPPGHSIRHPAWRRLQPGIRL
ncbi:superinfection immunity protein [Bradyrhizobium sp. SSUT112]|uniref:superinfection immunity protein n=1 Tax=Bradyrhizobium sp. SSUT112 TaxID=3040604 RepID=UPI00244D4251|nr:superinfection immunity protein [Bradyrhizobium sp. SSUT112]MDH2357210.1 superinfection immunity protein [Bradyrhizobium sp. SSUT112]